MLFHHVNKAIFENRVFPINKIDPMGHPMNIEEIQPMQLYSIRDFGISIKLEEIALNQIYDFYIIIDDLSSPKLGTTYNISDNLWIAKSDSYESQGNSLIDSIVGFLVAQGVI